METIKKEEEEDEDRLKDHLLDNVSTAIKQVQLESCGGESNWSKESNQIEEGGDDDKTRNNFTANMWQVQELCLQLDSAFNHGLKQATGGYWSFVRDLTHKSTVQVIVELKNAVTNVVRGWAWLYVALNDRALECYLRTVLNQPQLAEKYYLPHALLRDTQRLQVLVMMSSGLEHCSFALEPSTACLTSWKSVFEDSSITNNETDEEVEEAENLSLVSYDSRENLSGADDPELGIVTIVTFDPKTGLPASSSDDIVHSSSRAIRKRRKDRTNCSNQSITSNDNDSECSGLEFGVNENDSVRSLEGITKDPREERCLQYEKQTVSEDSDLDKDITMKDINKNVVESSKVLVEELEVKGEEIDRSVYGQEFDVASTTTSTITEEKPIEELAVAVDGVRLRDKGTVDRKSAVKRVSFDPDNMVSFLGTDHGTSNDENDWKLCLTERGTPEGQEDPMSSSTSSLNFGSKLYQITKSAKDRDLTISPWKLFPIPYAVDHHVMETSTKRVEDEIESEMKSARLNKLLEGEVPLENNFHLLLMLEVIDDQDEKVYKVFLGSIGNTIGSLLEIFVVLTDRRFYVTHWNDKEGHYVVDASVPFSDIEFLELGINYQMVNLVCVQPRRRYWICTGNEEITRNIVSSLEVAIRRCPQVTIIPNVFTDATAQSIGLCKWIAEETGSDSKTLKVDYYALVKWEDPLAILRHSSKPGGPSKEGFLMYRYTGRPVFGDKHWRPGYFRLKAGVCYQFSDALDRTFKSYVQLLGGGCTGCRRVQSSDRPHTFELILCDKRSLQLAAPSEEDASDWLQVFLQTVSQGFRDETEVPPRVSACLVQASETLFLCQEDLETNSVRSLRKAEIRDVASTVLDSDGSHCCILEFESVEATESCGDWMLYFESATELSKFMTSLSTAWQDMFKVPLSCTELSDPVLKKHCSLQQRTDRTSL